MIAQVEQHPIDKQIGERIRKRRLMCGFSQRDLGKKLGISFQHIQGYETGEVRLVVDRLYNLAEALSVDMSYFFTKASEDLHDKAFHRDTSSKEISRLVREYRKIKDGTLRDIIHSVIKALTNR
ncbi:MULTISPECIES: helix-turn-helix domain-containing protein [Wolbachia]|uniref:Helix-turn-helix transcriptional regulator n=1 Tax=Wolbachia pipientis TaxID=955 RepID=A0A7G5CCS1_WOLPI|nr:MULTISPECIES: helix-turn-helix transcriptional regulator [Wolbachia]MDE5060875.1 helix-turn-helix transcriptional regulator [Wolbachia endosymbiont of Drosophila nikananu]QMV47005.1 helix-turn-helix transcriptional regulator [Wolbachia pipientis]